MKIFSIFCAETVNEKFAADMLILYVEDTRKFQTGHNRIALGHRPISQAIIFNIVFIVILMPGIQRINIADRRCYEKSSVRFVQKTMNDCF